MVVCRTRGVVSTALVDAAQSTVTVVFSVVTRTDLHVEEGTLSGGVEKAAACELPATRNETRVVNFMAFLLFCKKLTN